MRDVALVRLVGAKRRVVVGRKRPVWPRRSRGPVLVDDVLLFLFAGADCRLPGGGLLTWSGSNCLDFLLFGLLGFPIAPLLAFGHVLLSFDNAVVEWQYLIDCHQAR